MDESPIERAGISKLMRVSKVRQSIRPDKILNMKEKFVKFL